MRPTHILPAILASLAWLAPAFAEPREAGDADVGRFVVEAVSSTLTRGGEGGDGAWLARVVSMTSTDGANAVLRLWAEAGVPDEPPQGASYAAQVHGVPEVSHLGKGEWRARAIVLQTYERGIERGGTGMQVEARVRQDAKSGALRLDGMTLRD